MEQIVDFDENGNGIITGDLVRCRECRLRPICRIGQHLGLDGFCSKGEREAQE